ncbi:hypothetical protein IGS59_09010 [Janthinobacterium sp. GW460P]|uniref:hypothetical protein n=1 Tax=unclassified Janthinobacterium TaxID=2610881 RepID=UPI000A322A04|nr:MULTISPECIES: hypothetical protein [unclassified Janthinobacterium]MCC7702376.1 hypothetical protein [Janthinobacterium sp. GW460P]MCC7707884.1 hypothetical protein [Janthinobacterium sp. GW460W]
MPLHDIHAVMQSYLDDGWLRDPQAVGLATFTAPELLALGFYELCDGGQLCLYEDERWFRRASRAVQTSFKVYLQGGRLHANGLELGYQVRLASVLRAARRPLPPYRLLLEAGARSGALLFENGLVLQFAANLRGAQRHYFLTLVEGQLPDPGAGDLDLRAASEGHVQALYDSRDPADLQRLARRGNAALRELAQLLS